MGDLPALRASDADRERTALALREAFVEGRLTLDELAVRLETAFAARTCDELEGATRELTLTMRARRRPKFLTAVVFGHVERRGRWRLPRRSAAAVVFGDADLDLRDAEATSDVVTIVALLLFGNADFYVPEGVEVDLGGLAMFGHRRERGRDLPPRAGTPLVRIRVFSLFGTSDVWRIPPGVGGGYRALIKELRRAERDQHALPR